MRGIWKWGREKEGVGAQAETFSVIVPIAQEDEAFLLDDCEGVPILLCTLRALEAISFVDEMIITVRAERMQEVAKLCKEYKLFSVKKILCARACMCTSLLLAACECGRETRYIAVADPAMPFVTEAFLWRILEHAQRAHAAAPATLLQGAVKEVDGRNVVRTVDVKDLYTLQMPQVIEADLMKAALQKAQTQAGEVRDLAAAMECLGLPFALVAGEEGNIRIGVETRRLLRELF